MPISTHSDSDSDSGVNVEQNGESVIILWKKIVTWWNTYTKNLSEYL